MLIRLIKTIAMEVFKSLLDLNPKCMKKCLISRIEICSKGFQPKFVKVIYAIYIRMPSVISPHEVLAQWLACSPANQEVHGSNPNTFSKR